MFKCWSISFILSFLAFLLTSSTESSRLISDHCSLHDDGIKLCCKPTYCYRIEARFQSDESQNPDSPYNIQYIYILYDRTSFKLGHIRYCSYETKNGRKILFSSIVLHILKYYVFISKSTTHLRCLMVEALLSKLQTMYLKI